MGKVNVYFYFFVSNINLDTNWLMSDPIQHLEHEMVEVIFYYLTILSRTTLIPYQTLIFVMASFLFHTPDEEGSYYVGPSVRPSLRPYLPPSIRPSVRLYVRPLNFCVRFIITLISFKIFS